MSRAELGATPIDYTKVDFVEEIHRLTGNGVDAVFDGIGGKHIWESRNAPAIRLTTELLEVHSSSTGAIIVLRRINPTDDSTSYFCIQ